MLLAVLILGLGIIVFMMWRRMERLNELAYTTSLALCFVEKNIKEGRVAEAEMTAREAIDIANDVTIDLSLNDESWRMFKYWSRVSGSK